MASAVVLAVLAAIQALDAVSVRTIQPFSSSQIFVVGSGSAAELMRGIICAVLAGVAFFTGLACFFWGALLESRQQMAYLLQFLSRGQ
jgi:hypothetical protein